MLGSPSMNTAREPGGADGLVANAIVVRRDPVHMPHGIRRRVDHLLDYYGRSDDDVDVVSVSSMRGVAELARLRVAGRTSFHVVALFQPGMMRLAGLLRQFGTNVTIDVCDSLTLLKATLEQEEGLLRTAEEAAATLRRLPNAIGVTYISRRDADADAAINEGRTVSVVPPTAPSSLSSLAGNMNGHIGRFTLSGDFASHHTREGIGLLVAGWRDHAQAFPAARLDIYGHNTEGLIDVPGARLRGFATDLRDLYSGNTAVLVPNVLASGVPNKLVEAVAAQRPVIAHQSLKAMLSHHEGFYSFRTAEDVTKALAEVSNAQFGPALPYMRYAL